MSHSKSQTQSIAIDTGTMGSGSKSLPPIESSAMVPLAASNCSIISHRNHQKQSSSSSQYRHYQKSHISKNFKKPHHSTQSECFHHHNHPHRLHHHSDNLLVHFIRSSTSLHLKQIFSLSIIFVVIVISFGMFAPVKGLEQVRVVALNVPSQVRKGSEVELSCFYDLGNASLYSLKWFYRANDTDLDEQEFFRYTPTIEPHKQFFPLEGVLEHVNVNKSKGGRVVIMDASGRTTGNYKCEISVEGTFQTVAAEKLMTVLVGNGAQSIRTNMIGLDRWNVDWQRYVWIGLLLLISCSWYEWLLDIHHHKSPLDHHLSIGSSLLAAASIGFSRTSNHLLSNWGQTTPKSPASTLSPHQSLSNSTNSNGHLLALVVAKLNWNILAQFTNNVIYSITVFLLIFCTLLLLLLLLGLDTKLLFIKNDIKM